MIKKIIIRDVLQNEKPLKQNNIQDKLRFAQINVNQQYRLSINKSMLKKMSSLNTRKTIGHKN